MAYLCNIFLVIIFLTFVFIEPVYVFNKDRTISKLISKKLSYKATSNIPSNPFSKFYSYIEHEKTCDVCDACQLLKYRSDDGSCNNLHNTRWGSAGTAFQRILPAAYEDGIWAPRFVYPQFPV